ncbi:MAG: hypothetical protein IPP55_18450 [Anaerolineales bacterium]|nr:hypothetical protein [Anaerolineales bacterium]
MKLKKLLFAFLFALPFIQKAGAQVVYCEPTFNNGCFSWNNKEITLDSISWTLGSSDCTISDYTTMGTTLTAGLPTPMEVLNGSWCGVGCGSILITMVILIRQRTCIMNILQVIPRHTAF